MVGFSFGKFVYKFYLFRYIVYEGFIFKSGKVVKDYRIFEENFNSKESIIRKNLRVGSVV